DPPAGLMDAMVIAFSLEGGTPRGSRLPPELIEPSSRIVVSANIEGAPRTMMIDTGASTIVLRRDLFSALASDGRRQSTVVAGSEGGASAATQMRTRSVAIGGAEVTRAVATSSVRFDESLDLIGREIGHPLD